MRIIHTSDWHLGQNFMGKTREREHRAFLAWLRKTVLDRKVDALVVTGDIFDTGTPPSYARAMYNEFIVSLQDTGCSQVLILGGNHDAAATLNEGKSLLACLKTRVVAGLSDRLDDHLITISNADGTPGLLICALPFLRPSDLIRSAGGQSGQEKRQILGRAIESLYTRVFDLALARGAALKADGHTAPLPVMATGHLTVIGGTASESVRDIYIGSLGGFPAAGFPPVDYVALGHLHGAQAIRGGKCSCIRYSGSPIPLSFDEVSREKQVVQVDFGPENGPKIKAVPIPSFRSLVSLRGNLEILGREIAAMADGTGERPADSPRTWLEVEVAEDDFLSDLTDRVQVMIKEAELEHTDLLRVRRQRVGTSPALVSEAVERLEELSPKEVFQRRLDLENLDREKEGKLMGLFEQILEQVTNPASSEESQA